MLVIGGVTLMAFDYYFAGATTHRIESVLVNLNANILKSFYTETSTLKRWFNYKKLGWNGKLFIDNGEFTMHRQGGTIDIDKYIYYLNTNDKYIDLAVALDKIPGTWGVPHTRREIDDASVITYNNYMYMRDNCKSPEKLLPVFHQEERLEFLQKLLNIDGLKYICISGRKDLTPDARKQFYSSVFNVIEQSVNPNIKVHCLGSGTVSDAEQFNFTSMDSTSCNMVAANGNIFVRDSVVYVGDGGKALSDTERRIIIEECEFANVKFEDLINYQDRAILNMFYMFEKSRKTQYVHSNIKKLRLFV